MSDYPTKINALERKFLRGILGLLFRLLYRKRHARLCLEKVEGISLLVPPEVFNPALFGSSPFMARYLKSLPLEPGTRALDLGCGSGLLGIVMAQMGCRVVATDVNPEAAWVAGVNAHLNGCQERHETRAGSLYEPVDGEKFGLIALNPPYYAAEPITALEHAFKAGPELETLVEMVAGAAEHLEPGGKALAVVSSTIPLKGTLEAAEKAGLRWQILARKRYWAEWHLIYEFRHA